MKKIKIAFTGVFDIDNFGDHLFPIIFENSLRKRKIDVELFLFSPYESTQGFANSNGHPGLFHITGIPYFLPIIEGTIHVSKIGYSTYFSSWFFCLKE